VAGGIEAFCQTVRAGLATATFAQRRLLIELLIDRVVVTDGEVEIRYVLPTSPDGPHPSFCQLRKDHLDRPADPGHPDQPDQGRASRAKQVQKASTPSERLRRTSSQRTSAAALGAVNTTRIQSYSRRPLTPWPGYRSPLLSRRTDGQLLGRGPRRPLCWPQQLGALDGQHIAQAAVLQEAPQRLVAAVGLVGGDPAGWDLGI